MHALCGILYALDAFSLSYSTVNVVDNGFNKKLIPTANRSRVSCAWRVTIVLKCPSKVTQGSTQHVPITVPNIMFLISPPLSILNWITVTLSITTFQTINLTGSNRSRTLLLVLLLRLLNPHVSLLFSDLSTGLRSTNALNINSLLPTKFLQPVNLAILTI